ncbi:hypothetical protein AB0L70_12640 [Kribbella sp. NPDC051952]|uniref:hypothetical protein n=1 Tax=Kribbella sp. NPDC051952 TaxID=3154851 RepID=UPI00343AF519
MGAIRVLGGVLGAEWLLLVLRWAERRLAAVLRLARPLLWSVLLRPGLLLWSRLLLPSRLLRSVELRSVLLWAGLLLRSPHLRAGLLWPWLLGALLLLRPRWLLGGRVLGWRGGWLAGALLVRVRLSRLARVARRTRWWPGGLRGRGRRWCGRGGLAEQRVGGLIGGLRVIALLRAVTGLVRGSTVPGRPLGRARGLVFVLSQR